MIQLYAHVENHQVNLMIGPAKYNLKLYTKNMVGVKDDGCIGFLKGESTSLKIVFNDCFDTFFRKTL